MTICVEEKVFHDLLKRFFKDVVLPSALVVKVSARASVVLPIVVGEASRDLDTVVREVPEQIYAVVATIFVP